MYCYENRPLPSIPPNSLVLGTFPPLSKNFTLKSEVKRKEKCTNTFLFYFKVLGDSNVITYLCTKQNSFSIIPGSFRW